MPKNKIKDEELKQISGGNGIIPDGGIKFSSYENPKQGHYYSADQTLNDVIYVTNDNGNIIHLNYEDFKIDGNNWTSSAKDFGWLYLYEVKIFYPYELNIQL